MTLFTDSGFTYTIPWLTALCNDLQIHVDRKDAAFAAADEAHNAPSAGPANAEPLPAPKPTAKPATAERSPFCDSLSFAGATVRLCTVLLVRPRSDAEARGQAERRAEAQAAPAAARSVRPAPTLVVAVAA